MRRAVRAWSVLALVPLLGVTLVMRGVGGHQPDFASVRADWRSSQARLLSVEGEVLQTRRIDLTEQRGDWVPLATLPPVLTESLLRIEDVRFREHGGVDLVAMAAAVRAQLAGHTRGGSTITMQLAGLLQPTASHGGRRGLAQKWRQMRAAWQIERRWTKDEILEAYLNRVSFRGELTGIGAAARGLFGKPAASLDNAESILLATLIAAPNASQERVVKRGCALAARLRLPAGCDDLTNVARGSIAAGAVAAHADEPQPQLAPQLGVQLLQRAGEQVASTLSAPLQRAVHDILRRQLASLGGANVRDGAVLVVDNPTGDVLAYVGSAGPASTATQVDGARALRQAGSTLKPFLYARAFGRRLLTPVSLLDDAPLNLDTSSGLYAPQNYDREFKGIVSARTALASSLNIPAVRTLMLVGLDDFLDQLQTLGFADLRHDADYYGYSLALGSAEVSLRQQVNAFRALATGGLASPLRYRPDDPQVVPRRVIDAAAAFLVTDILSDAAARAVTFGLDSPLATPFWSAAKTGTSKDLRDNWCIGYSSRYTVGVWVGNFEGDSMRGVSGVTGAAPVWLEVMQRLHAGVASTPPSAPEGVTSVAVQFQPAIEPARRSYFLAGTEMSRVELLAPDAVPQLISPAPGTVIALDPDIPRPRQRVLLQARGAAASMSLWLNGRRLASAARPYIWPPTPGDHVLDLRDAAGARVDTTRFTVREP